MAKKVKRQARKTSATPVVVAHSENMSAAARERSSAGSAAANSSGAAFNPDYSQTIKDLKRIGILAGTFFGVLVVLALFLR